MKLPTYTSGPAPSLPGVDPSVYRELGRAQTEFAQTIGQANEAVAQQYIQTSTADFNANKANLAKRDAEIKQYLKQTPFERADNIPPDMYDESMVETQTSVQVNPVTGEEEQVTERFVPTHRIAEKLYQQEMDKYAGELAGNARTRLSGDRLRQDYRESIAPKGKMEIAEFTYRQTQQANRVSFDQNAQQYIDIGDSDGLRSHIERAKFAGIISEGEATAAWQSGMETMQTTSYQASMANPHAPDEVLRSMPADIESDKWIPAEKKPRLIAQAVQRWETQNVNKVGEALVERNFAELARLKAYYQKDQGDKKEHPSGLDGAARNRLVNQIDSGIRGINAAADATRKRDQALAKERITQIRAQVEAGASVDLLRNVDSLLDVAYPSDSNKESDIRARHKAEQMLANSETYNTLAKGNADEVQATLDELNAKAATGSLDDKLLANEAQKYAEDIQQLKEADPLGFAIEQGLVEPIEIDWADTESINEGIRAEAEAMGAISEHFGVTPTSTSKRTATIFGRLFDGASPVDRAAMIESVSIALGGDPAKMHDFWVMQQSGEISTSWVLGAQGADANTVDASARGRFARTDPAQRAVLVNAGFGPSDQNAQLGILGDDLLKFWPETGAERAEEAINVAAGYVIGGMSVDAAIKKATRDLFGDPVSNVGSRSDKVIPPTPETTQRVFHREQRAISNDTYKAAGYSGRESMRKLVKDGDVVFKNSDWSPSKYRLWDTRDDLWITTSGGDFVEIDWNDRGMPVESGDKSFLDKLRAAPTPTGSGQ